MGLFLRCLHFTPINGQKYYKFTEITTQLFLWMPQHCDRAMDWTILNSIKLTTYYLIIWFLRCLTLVQSVAPRQICAEIICLLVDLLALGSFMHANGRWKTLQMFSFTDFRDVVSELALHAESKMIIFATGRFIFYWMTTAPGLLTFLQASFFIFFKFYTKWAFFVLIMNWQP